MLKYEDYEREIVRIKNVSGGRVVLCKLTYPATSTPWAVWFFNELGQPKDGCYYNDEIPALRDFRNRNS